MLYRDYTDDEFDFRNFLISIISDMDMSPFANKDWCKLLNRELKTTLQDIDDGRVLILGFFNAKSLIITDIDEPRFELRVDIPLEELFCGCVDYIPTSELIYYSF